MTEPAPTAAEPPKPQPVADSPIERASRWLESHRPGVLVAIVAVAALMRIGYFVEVSGGPLRVQHEAAESDMNFFHEWGRRLASGDWLTREPYHPLHAWHHGVAEAYFRERPEAETELIRAGAATADERARRLWNRWYGGPLYHQEPLYPYLVAATYAVFGPDVRWVFAWQMVLGVLTVVLIYLVALRHFDALVATLAALMTVLCGPLLAYDGILLRTSPAAFFGILVVWLSDRALERGTWARWLAAGAAFGAAILLQATFVLPLACVAAVLAWRLRRELRRLAAQAGVLAGGVLLVLAPAIARNAIVRAPLLGLSSVGPITFLCANAGSYDPYAGFAPNLDHAPRIMGATDGRFGPVVTATLRTHGSVGSYVRQVGRKFNMMWHWYEEPNNACHYFHELYSSTLRLAPVTFALLSPLGLVGLALAARRAPSRVMLYAIVGTSVAAMLLFYVLGRFRAPMAPVLAPFAAFAAVRVVERLRARGWWPAAAALAAVAILTVWAWWPLPRGKPLIPFGYYAITANVYYLPRATDAMSRGDFATTEGLMRELLLREPPVVATLSRARRPVGRDENHLAVLFGNFRYLLARALEKQGKKYLAAQEDARAMELLEIVDPRETEAPGLGPPRRDQ